MDSMIRPLTLPLLPAFLTSLCLSAALAFSAEQGAGPAQPTPLDPSIRATFVPLGNGNPGVLYEPVNPGPKAQVAVLAEHSALDYLTHSSCTELSKRGYRVFCVNNSNDKSRAFNGGALDRVMLETKRAVEYLRKYPGVRKIVLWGHSGGATVMTAYQDTAQNGVAACQEAVKIYKCPDTLAGLPPADGIILGDPNWGIANSVLTAIDPAVGLDSGKIIDPDLDMFNPKNGFNPNGSKYSSEFIRRFLAAQARRNNELVDRALERHAAIKAGRGAYSDDELFVVPGALFTQNKLYTTDMRLLSRTQKPWPLLHKDGSITVGIVPSVRVPTTTENDSHSLLGAALKTTVLGFLSTYAIRVTDAYGYGEETAETGVVWRSSRGSNPGNAEGITVPFLTMAMTGSFEMGSAETIHNQVKGADKTLVFVEGASHNYTVCRRCERTPGQYGDTVKLLYDYADQWLSKPGRFL
jgi:pimeloyl-ACP methyl ester carboxylesterase